MELLLSVISLMIFFLSGVLIYKVRENLLKVFVLSIISGASLTFGVLVLLIWLRSILFY